MRSYINWLVAFAVWFFSFIAVTIIPAGELIRLPFIFLASLISSYAIFTAVGYKLDAEMYKKLFEIANDFAERLIEDTARIHLLAKAKDKTKKKKL